MYDSEGVRWLDCGDLVEINQVVINLYTPSETAGVRDRNSLESAQRAPSVHRFYAQTEDMFILSAVLLSRLIRNHPFHNGNKRTAYTGARMLLWMNGYRLHPPQEEVLEVCCALATHDVDEDQAAYWLSCHAFEFDLASAIDRMASEEVGKLVDRLLREPYGP